MNSKSHPRHSLTSCATWVAIYAKPMVRSYYSSSDRFSKGLQRRLKQEVLDIALVPIGFAETAMNWGQSIARNPKPNNKWICQWNKKNGKLVPPILEKPHLSRGLWLRYAEQCIPSALRCLSTKASAPFPEQAQTNLGLVVWPASAGGFLIAKHVAANPYQSVKTSGQTGTMSSPTTYVEPQIVTIFAPHESNCCREQQVKS